MQDDTGKSAKLIYNPDRTGILQLKDGDGKAIGQTNLKGVAPWRKVTLALDCMQIVMNEYVSMKLARENIKGRISELKASLDPDGNAGDDDDDDDDATNEEEEK